MIFQARPPRHRLLQPLVEQVWYCEIPGASGSEILLPTGRGQLVVGLDPDHPGAVVQGPMARAHEISAAMQRRAAGAAFTVGGVAACVAADAHLLADGLFGLDDLWPRRHWSLADELASQASPAAVLDRLEATLLALVTAAGQATDPAVDAAIDLLGVQLPVASVADRLGLDRRALTGRFRARVGLGLKQFGRLHRFEQAVQAVRADNAAPLGQIAAELGYADQAHLTREFRAFSGFTPAVLHRDGSPSPNHVPV
ncbi:MAG: helix-turn-helix domain-containing protein [Actinomycetota bacterium]